MKKSMKKRTGAKKMVQKTYTMRLSFDYTGSPVMDYDFLEGKTTLGKNKGDYTFALGSKFLIEVVGNNLPKSKADGILSISFEPQMKADPCPLEAGGIPTEPICLTNLPLMKMASGKVNKVKPKKFKDSGWIVRDNVPDVPVGSYCYYKISGIITVCTSTGIKDFEFDPLGRTGPKF